MQFLRRSPLKYQLVLLTLVSSGMGLIVALGAFLSTRTERFGSTSWKKWSPPRT